MGSLLRSHAFSTGQGRPGAPRGDAGRTGHPGGARSAHCGGPCVPRGCQAAASPSRGGSGRRQRRASAAQPPAALPLGRNGRWVPGEASCGSESPGELLNKSLPQSWECVRRELPGDCAARRGTRYFPSECSNAREGDADEQPRGGGGDGRHRGDRRCEGPLVDGSPPAWLQRQVRWLQGPEARAGTLAAPLPPARAGRGPCGSQDILVQCVLCSTSGDGPSGRQPREPKGF